MTLGEFLNKLAAKAGIKADDPNLVGVLAAPGLQQMPIADELAQQFDNSLLTIAAATNNHPDVKRVYFAQAYNGLDAELDQTMTDLGFDENAKAAIKAEKSSTKRAALVAVKAKEIATEASKGSGVDAGKVQTLQADIIRLNGLLADKDKIFNEAKNGYEGKLLDIRKQGDLKKLIEKYKTVYDDLPAEAKDAAIDALINKNLQDSGAMFGYDEKGAFTILRSEGGPLFGDNHTVVTPDVFIDKSLSKILKQTDAQQPNGPVVFGNTRQTGQQQQQQSAPANSALSAKLAESMQAYNASGGQ